MQETWVQFLGWEDPLKEGMQPTPVFLPEEFHGQRSLVGYSPWDHKEQDTTEQLSKQAPTHRQCWVGQGSPYTLSQQRRDLHWRGTEHRLPADSWLSRRTKESVDPSITSLLQPNSPVITQFPWEQLSKEAEGEARNVTPCPSTWKETQEWGRSIIPNAASVTRFGDGRVKSKFISLLPSIILQTEIRKISYVNNHLKQISYNATVNYPRDR